MPESSLSDVSSSQVLYSCQYDQQLYRQHVLQRHVTLPSQSDQLGQHSRSLPEFRRDLGSCRYVETLSPAQNGTERNARYRKVRQHKYRTTSHLHLRSLRYSQRHSFLTSDHSRRKRFPTIAQRKAANVREQKRMYNLKEAFKSLRECLPTFSYEKKMSRIETLRLSITYIGFLKKLLNECDQNPLSQISQNQSNTGREC